MLHMKLLAWSQHKKENSHIHATIHKSEDWNLSEILLIISSRLKPVEVLNISENGGMYLFQDSLMNRTVL